MTHSFPTRRSSDLCGNVNLFFWMWPRIEGHSAPPLPPAAIDRIVKQIFRRPSPVLFGGQQNGPLSAHDRYSRSEEHTSELQSLMRISYAVFCLKKKKEQYTNTIT